MTFSCDQFSRDFKAARCKMERDMVKHRKAEHLALIKREREELALRQLKALHHPDRWVDGFFF